MYSQRSPTAEPLMCPSDHPVQTGLTICTASAELPELSDRNTDELPKYTFAHFLSVAEVSKFFLGQQCHKRHSKCWKKKHRSDARISLF